MTITEAYAEIERLHKQVKDKDQAILLLNELLDTTDTENAMLRQQVSVVGVSHKEAYQEGWHDCEEHQKDRLGDQAWDEHPMWTDGKSSMPWTSREGGDRE